MTKKDNIVPVEIFSGNQGEVDFVVSLLENAEIEVFLKDEYVGTILPHIALSGVAPITIVISSEDKQKATEVIEEYLKSKEN